jgi:conjugative transposon TraJ protein
MILLSAGFDNMHQILRTLYVDMMPLCATMAGVARGIAGLGALFYVAYRVWQSLARAEPIDVFPLLRPFAIGLCIMFFPVLVIGTLNTILSPIVRGTHQLLEGQKMDMRLYQQQKDQLEDDIMSQNMLYLFHEPNEEFDRELSEMRIDVTSLHMLMGLETIIKSLNLRNRITKIFRKLLELIFDAAALIIDTLRTFFLIVLTILGPLAFAFSVWDGFQSTMTQWFSRYISIYLWLPVCDLFSAVLARIQVITILKDIQNMQTGTGGVFESADAVYIAFMLIGIVGYFTIPTVANWIISASIGGYNRNINTMATKAGAFAGGAAGAGVGNISGRLFRNSDNQSN